MFFLCLSWPWQGHPYLKMLIGISSTIVNKLKTYENNVNQSWNKLLVNFQYYQLGIAQYWNTDYWHSMIVASKIINSTQKGYQKEEGKKGDRVWLYQMTSLTNRQNVTRRRKKRHYALRLFSFKLFHPPCPWKKTNLWELLEE